MASGVEFGTAGLAYMVSGPAGAPRLVLAHGVTDNAASLASAQRHWSKTHTVMAVDARGHGLSPAFERGQLADPIEQMVADMVTLLDRTRGDAPTILVGHSMGAAVCAQAAVRAPELADAVILEDPAWLNDQQAKAYEGGAPALCERMEWIRRNPAEALGTNRQDYPRWTAEEAVGWLQGKLQVDLDFLTQGLVSPAQPWQEVAAALRVPTLVVTADGADVLLGDRGIREIQSVGNPAIQTRSVAGASHCIRRDRPDEFYAVCDPFLAGVLTR